MHSDDDPSAPASRSTDTAGAADAFHPAAVRAAPSAPPDPIGAAEPADPAGAGQRRRGPRPVPPGVEYHRVLAGDKRRIGRGILAIALVVAGLLGFNIIIAQAAAVIDTQLGNTNPTLGGTDYTPIYHAANLVSIALITPWSMGLQRWLYGVRGPSLHSVVSRFRFDVFGRAFLFIGPVWLLISIGGLNFMPVEPTQWSPAGLIAIVATTLLLTPLQAAGEEYGFRGLVFRVTGSWNRGPRTALVVGVLVSSLVFTVVHFAPDPWFNVWCGALAVSMAVITWRTGGVETAVVVHALNNTITFLLLTVLHADQNAAMERSVGSGTPFLLLPSATVVAIAAVVWLRTRRTGPALTPAAPSPVPPHRPEHGTP